MRSERPTYDSPGQRPGYSGRRQREALKGRSKSLLVSGLCRPFRAMYPPLALFPRALPWAVMLWPFRPAGRFFHNRLRLRAATKKPTGALKQKGLGWAFTSTGAAAGLAQYRWNSRLSLDPLNHPPDVLDRTVLHIHLDRGRAKEASPQRFGQDLGHDRLELCDFLRVARG